MTITDKELWKTLPNIDSPAQQATVATSSKTPHLVLKWKFYAMAQADTTPHRTITSEY